MMTVRFVMLLLAAMLGPADAGYLKEVAAWRAKHEADYTREYVPLSGLFFLKPGINTAGSGPTNAITLPRGTPPAIGRFVYEHPQVRFEPQPGARVTIKGQPVT